MFCFDFNLLPSPLRLLSGRRGGGTPYDGLYVDAPPERGIFFMLQVYERVGISLVEMGNKDKRVGETVI